MNYNLNLYCHDIDTTSLTLELGLKSNKSNKHSLSSILANCIAAFKNGDGKQFFEYSTKNGPAFPVQINPLKLKRKGLTKVLRLMASNGYLDHNRGFNVRHKYTGKVNIKQPQWFVTEKCKDLLSELMIPKNVKYKKMTYLRKTKKVKGKNTVVQFKTTTLTKT